MKMNGVGEVWGIRRGRGSNGGTGWYWKGFHFHLCFSSKNTRSTSMDATAAVGYGYGPSSVLEHLGVMLPELALVFDQLLLSMEQHKRFSVNAPPDYEASFCFELGFMREPRTHNGSLSWLGLDSITRGCKPSALPLSLACEWSGQYRNYSIHVFIGTRCELATEGAVYCGFADGFCGFSNGDRNQIDWIREFRSSKYGSQVTSMYSWGSRRLIFASIVTMF